MAFTSTKAGHTGLGLPATLLIINQLHGRISVTSQVGQGATIHILLPGAPAIPEQALEPKDEPESILLIDDDDTRSQFALSTLKAAGKNISCRPNLEGAPELILVDDAIETVYVLEVLENLKQAGLISRTVVVAAALMVETTTVYLQAGVKNVVLKPYTSGEFATLLAE